MQRKRTFRPSIVRINDNTNIKFYFYAMNGSKFLKSVPKETLIAELPKICLKEDYDNNINYTIYIDDLIIRNPDKSLSNYKDKCTIRFTANYPKICYFSTADNPEAETIDYSKDNFFQLLNINPNTDIFYIFNSEEEKEEITPKNYKNVLKSNENYYFIKYPKSLKDNLKSISLNRKEFFSGIMTQTSISKSDLQQILCILYRLDEKKKIKQQILQKIEEYTFIPLKYFTQRLLASIDIPFIKHEYFLPFLVSLQSIKIDSRNYIEVFEDLFKQIDHPRPISPIKNDQLKPISPFKIRNLRELFFNQNVEINSFIQLNDLVYLYKGESKSDDDKSTYYDPLTDETVDFDFADYFLNESRSGSHLNFEDIFFDTREFELNDQIGEGGFGTIYKAFNVNDGELYAAKIIITSYDFDGQDQMRLMRESVLLKKLHHPSIIKFIGFNFQSFKDPILLEPTIITEYMPNGSLQKIIDSQIAKKKTKQKTGKNDINDFWNLTKKIITVLGVSNAMRYLHQHGIVHRDLKPSNILMDENYYPQICDFDLSRCFPDAFTNSLKITLSCQFGTPVYLSPEIIEGATHFSPSVDVYAFGITLFEIISDTRAYSDIIKSRTSIIPLLNKIVKGARPTFNKNFTEKMKLLLTKCWNKKISNRPTFDEIFKSLTSDLAGYFGKEFDQIEVQNYLKKIGQIPDPPALYILDKIPVETYEIDKIFFDTKQYKIMNRKIGKGAFSTAYFAKKRFLKNKENDKKIDNNDDADDDEEKFVDNLVLSARVINTDIFKGYDQMLLSRESIILNKLTHPSIIKFYGLNFQSFYDNKFIKPTILNEYLKNGSLKNILQPKFYSNFDDTKKCICLIGIAHAMRFVHSKNIIHGFLSLDNILLDENNYPRISFPHSFSNLDQMSIINHFSKQKYIAPELLNNDVYDKRIDVYAFGILSYEILTGREAFFELRNKVDSIQLRSKIISGARPKKSYDIPSDLLYILEKCWSSKLDERPSFDCLFRELSKHFAYLCVDKEMVNNFVENVLEENDL